MDFRKIEKLQECPFNPAHQILPHRMAAHLVKCKKNHLDADVKQCVFNATHYIKTPLYQAHLLECPDRAIVERDLYRRQKDIEQTKEQEKVAQYAIDIVSSSAPACNEDWDNELVSSSYNPAEHVVYKEITRPPPPGMGKAARRAWRAREIERVQRLKEGKPIDDLICDIDNAVLSSQSPESDEKVDPVQSIASAYTGDKVNGVGAEGLSITKKQDTADSITSSSMMKCDIPLRRPRIAANIFRGAYAAKQVGENASSLKEREAGDEESASVKEIIKQKRKLEKLLVGITRLENKIADGHEPSPEERKKINSRNEIELRLAKLLDGVNL